MILAVLKFVVITLCITIAIPFGLIASQWPSKGGNTGLTEGLDFEATVAAELETAPEPALVPMRDGWSMPVRRYGTQDASKPLVILAHGSGWNGLHFNGLAQELAGEAYILAPDLRGHGAQPERRGDVDYIGQMEDDLADLIAAETLLGQRVTLGGHSSGGGLVVRFAGGAHGDLIDHAVLIAPFLKYNAPATRADSGGWANLLLRRVIGLSILNGFGVTALNGLTVIQFNMPTVVLEGDLGHLATTAYSFRLNTGFAPRSDYLSDVAALPEFTLVVGSADEAFYAEKYEEDMSAVTDKGTYIIAPGVNHLAIVTAGATVAALRAAFK